MKISHWQPWVWRQSKRTNSEFIDTECQCQQHRLHVFMLSMFLQPNEHGRQEHAHVFRCHFVQRHQLNIQHLLVIANSSSSSIQQINSIHPPSLASNRSDLTAEKFAISIQYRPKILESLFDSSAKRDKMSTVMCYCNSYRLIHGC